MADIKDQANSVYRDFKVDGVPASGQNDPDKGEIRALFAAVDIAIAAAQAGLKTVATTTDRDAFYATEANRDKLVYVNNNNGSATDAANGVYEYAGGGPRIATSFYNGVATVVQPLVDEATDAAAQVNSVATDLETAASLTSESPNLFPASAMTGAGWTGGVTTGVSADGRSTIKVTGINAYISFPASAFGGIGSPLSAGVDIEAFTYGGSGGNGAVFIRYLNSNGTVAGVDVLFEGGSGQDSSTRQRFRRNDLTVQGDAVVQFYIGASANASQSITISVPGLYKGDSAAYRSPRPTASAVFADISPYVAGSTANRPAGAPAGWLYSDVSLGAIVISNGAGGWSVYNPGVNPVAFTYYVDPAHPNASDLNDGRSSALPFSSLSAAVSAAGSLPNIAIGIRYGSVFRNQSIDQPAAPGLSISGYGDKALGPWISLGSDSYTSFTAAGTNQYSIMLGYEPSTCALVDPQGGWHKLYLDNDGTLATGRYSEWKWSSNTLTFAYLGDLTGWRLEVPRNDGTGYGQWTGAADQLIQDGHFRCWRDHGTTHTHANARYIDSRSDYNGFDGHDGEYGGSGSRVATAFGKGGCNFNGRRMNGMGGPGDGISLHNLAAMTVIGETFVGNTQTGVGNEPDTTFYGFQLYFEDNQTDYQVYNQVGGSPGDHTTGSHTLDYSIVVRKNFAGGNWFAVIGNAVPAGTVKVRNVSVYYDPSLTGFLTSYVAGMTVEIDNLALRAAGFSNGLARYDGSLISRNNIVSVGGSAWQSGQNPTTETALLTGDPQFVSPPANLSLRAASPAIGSGLSVGLAQDFYGNAVGSIPDRGAIERQ